MDDEHGPVRSPRKGKGRIYRNRVKERMTSHWDWDTLSHDELAQEIEQGRRERRRYKLKQSAWIVLSLLVLCLSPTLADWIARAWSALTAA